MKILGIDPGYGRVGWAVVEGNKSKQVLVECGCIETDPKKDLEERLDEIFTSITDLIKKHQPEKAFVESLFFFKNQKTVMAVGQARGVIVLSIYKSGLPCFHLTPLQIKSTVAGYGKASKEQVQMMVKSQLKLTKVPKPDDAADACAVAISGFFMNY